MPEIMLNSHCLKICFHLLFMGKVLWQRLCLILIAKKFVFIFSSWEKFYDGDYASFSLLENLFHLFLLEKI